MAWIFPLVAGLFEIGFTTCLKLSDGFTKVVPSVSSSRRSAPGLKSLDICRAAAQTYLHSAGVIQW